MLLRIVLSVAALSGLAQGMPIHHRAFFESRHRMHVGSCDKEVVWSAKEGLKNNYDAGGHVAQHIWGEGPPIVDGNPMSQNTKTLFESKAIASKVAQAFISNHGCDGVGNGKTFKVPVSEIHGWDSSVGSGDKITCFTCTAANDANGMCTEKDTGTCKHVNFVLSAPRGGKGRDGKTHSMIMNSMYPTP